jgi:hypothetical protein
MRRRRLRKNGASKKAKPMTVETKTTIQLSDITAIEFECKNCHATLSWPVAIFKHPPTACPCRTDQHWMAQGGSLFEAITEMVENLRGLSKAGNEPFIMRLGVRELSASGRDSTSFYRDSGD